MFRIDISTGNAAFEPEPGYELARILRELADHVEQGKYVGILHDINGNNVGRFSHAYH